MPIPPPEWAKLDSAEISRRILAEMCDECGASPQHLCQRESDGQPMKGYTHSRRQQAAHWTFRQELQQRRQRDG